MGTLVKEWFEGGGFWLTRLVFQRSLGLIYLVAFINAVNQFRPLLGERGLQPAPLFLKRVRFWDAPSLFWLKPTDKAFAWAAWAGVVLSGCAMGGLTEWFGLPASMATWGAMWVLYLSFVNVGQSFYGFGWESILLETGFLAMFLGDGGTDPPVQVMWLLRWVLFRVMFGAGLIKLRGDRCWRDLTCMNYHYETQPIPGPLSRHFHLHPPWFHRTEVAFTHFVELLVPFGYFAPAPISYIAGLLTIGFQATLILSGNLSWLNWLTIVLCLPCFDDAALRVLMPLDTPVDLASPVPYRVAVWAVTAMVAFLSIRPIVNMLSPRQAMNRSFDPLHMVNTYGAFGSVSRERYEVIVEGTGEGWVHAGTEWREYEFKAKPGDVKRHPRWLTPYHLRLDWLMWFAAMGSYNQYPWILNLAAKLLRNDKPTLRLIAANPFPDEPPKFIRAMLYRYRFTTRPERRGSRHWWVRTLVRPYLPPLSLDDPGFKELLRKMEWEA